MAKKKKKKKKKKEREKGKKERWHRADHSRPQQGNSCASLQLIRALFNSWDLSCYSSFILTVGKKKKLQRLRYFKLFMCQDQWPCLSRSEIYDGNFFFFFSSYVYIHAALSIMTLDVLYHQEVKEPESHYQFWFCLHQSLAGMIPPFHGAIISSMSHQMDYSSLISINLAEKLLANDPNLKVFEDSFWKKMRALKQKEES